MNVFQKEELVSERKEVSPMAAVKFCDNSLKSRLRMRKLSMFVFTELCYRRFNY